MPVLLASPSAAHGERSAALAPLLALLGYAYCRSARVTFGEGLFREATKLLRLDPARLPAHGDGGSSGAAAAAAAMGVHASVAAVLAWRFAQLLWVLPNRGEARRGGVGARPLAQECMDL